jgi:hypothetical protein
MGQSLEERLRLARHFNFVGRTTELNLFRQAVTSDELPFHVLYVFGPGGVGKSTLLHEYIYLCQNRHIATLYLDARTLEPSPENFTIRLRELLQLHDEQSIFGYLAEKPSPFVILVDTYEIIRPLDDWLREVYLPQLPQNVLVVLASRFSPSRSWRTDPGWQIFFRSIPLRNLEPEESRSYLALRNIPQEQHEDVLHFTFGHPLALSLIADLYAQREDFTFQPEETVDVVKTLLENFVQKVPSPAHRAALDICALMHLTTEALLANLLDIPDVHDLFEWLRGLSFIEIQRDGLFPHDLAREALVTDLRWRNPAWYAELHRRARTYYTQQVHHTSGNEQQQLLFELIYLHRENAAVRPFFEWQINGTVITDVLQPQDVQLLQQMVAKHEGEMSARLSSYWFSRMPQTVVVWRDARRQPIGFLMILPLHEFGPDHSEVDPAVRATWLYLQNHAPLRPTETALLFRFWMAEDSYQAVSAIQSLVFVNAVRHYLATPRLAYTFFPCADPNFWEAVFSYADLTRIRSADFTVGEKRYGVYGHDWRMVPPMAWLALLAERELSNTAHQPAPSHVKPLIVLSKVEFEHAVRSALRDYTQAAPLRRNPLLQSRLVHERGDEDVSTLQQLLRESVDVLQRAPRQSKLYRALYYTYFDPAPTQERAAEMLDLPFSTYRRHLKAGLDWLTEYLWQIETGDLKK